MKRVTYCRIESSPLSCRGRLPNVITVVGGVFLICLAGCATVKPTQDYGRTLELIEESTGFERAYHPEEVGLSEDELREALARGLTLPAAVELALLNNRQLQVAFLGIGIARADLVQSGLFTNPSLGVGVLFPVGGGRSNVQGILAQNIVQLWRMPLEKRSAGHALEQRIVSTARMAGELVSQTKRAYYLGVATQDLVDISQQNLNLVTRSYETISAQREAGTASMLDDSLQRGEMLKAELGLRNARLAAREAKRALARLLSLDQHVEEVELTDALPHSHSPDLDSERLIAAARRQRLDLRALSEAVRRGEAEVELAYPRIFPEVSAGIGAERLESRGPSSPQDIDAMWGPNLSVTLPIFDQNQAQQARAKYEHTQAIKSYEDLYLSIAQDIRIAIDHVTVSWTTVTFYRNDLLPQAQKNLELTHASYTSGTTNILAVLESQRALLDTRRGYVLAWLKASTAVSDLERAVGLPLETTTADVAGADSIDISLLQAQDH